MDFNSILTKIKQFVSPSVANGAIKSPISQRDFEDNNNPALQAYYSYNQDRENNPVLPTKGEGNAYPPFRIFSNAQKPTPTPAPAVIPSEPEMVLSDNNPGLSFQDILGATTSPDPSPSSTPSPTPQAAPTPTLIPGMPDNPYTDMVKGAFPEDQVNNALNVMFGESGASGYNPLTYNTNSKEKGSGVAKSLDELMQIVSQYPKTDVGPYQINNYWQRQNLPEAGYTIQDMTDPQKAIEYATWLQEKNGWNPWYSAKKFGIVE